MLEIKNLSFSYGAKRVLDKLSFSVSPGELVCVLGPNGVGKSTLFKCILGLLKGYSGDILLGGRSLRSLSEADLARLVAYIPQAHVPAYGFSVFDVVLMGSSSARSFFAVPGHREEEAARHALETLGILDMAARNYAELSGGERQLVLIARALAQGGRLLIMDEPTANLDYGNQVRIMEHIAGLTADGYSVLLSTHNPEHAFLWSNRTLVLHKGHLIADGPPAAALTEQSLEALYGIPVRLFSLGNDKTGRYQACMPALELREVCQ
ncbi:ABC transporter ATP-binding protein [Gracilinema caldarium]|uniref:ABC transporter ATP-binding protein n=1 Tax=Gracilinema caldarium TaxID=215591 RepID=UPI0026F02A48|nr:ABC transporter ATP-binding protein [Gracilinema caldarium]